jgi:hypothetical protein
VEAVLQVAQPLLVQAVAELVLFLLEITQLAQMVAMEVQVVAEAVHVLMAELQEAGAMV